MPHHDGSTRATVVAAHTSRTYDGRSAGPGPGARSRRFDVLLDIDRGAEPPERVQLREVELGDVAPLMGSTVRVAPGADGGWEIHWRGDPNLDVEAHREQIARLAERARRRPT